jgi:hypothetical protein
LFKKIATVTFAPREGKEESAWLYTTRIIGELRDLYVQASLDLHGHSVGQEIT